MTIKIPDVNLRQRDPSRWWIPDTLTVALVVLVLLGNAGMVAYGQVLRAHVRERQAQVARTEGEIRTLEQQLPVLAEREERVRKLRQQLEAIRKLSQNTLRYANLLVEIAGALPEGVWLDSLTLDPARLRMKGKVVAPLPLRTLSELVNQLRATRLFQRVEIQSASRSSEPGFSFELEAGYAP